MITAALFVRKRRNWATPALGSCKKRKSYLRRIASIGGTENGVRRASTRRVEVLSSFFLIEVRVLSYAHALSIMLKAGLGLTFVFMYRFSSSLSAPLLVGLKGAQCAINGASHRLRIRAHPQFSSRRTRNFGRRRGLGTSAMARGGAWPFPGAAHALRLCPPTSHGTAQPGEGPESGKKVQER